jgi:type I pantothenate kinase
VETWFLQRFMGLWHAAEHDPASFYVRFRTISAADAETFARGVWARINLPNLRDHISLARDGADIVLRKQQDHALTWVRG